MRRRLGLWGIRTLGALAALPETQLIARMGQEGKRLRLMARGEWPHHFMPHEAGFVLQERMELDAPVEAMESLLFGVGMMLEQVIVRASARVLALASVTLTLGLEGGGTHVRRVRPALPTNDRGGVAEAAASGFGGACAGGCGGDGDCLKRSRGVRARCSWDCFRRSCRSRCGWM